MLIAENDGAAVGMVLSYGITKAPEDDPGDLPDPIAPFVALEKLSSGTWYVNALAVLPGNCGHGVGTQLMAAAENLSQSNGFQTISIQVYGQNEGAVRLYHALDYILTAREPVRLHPGPPYYTGEVLLLKKRLTPGLHSMAALGGI